MAVLASALACSAGTKQGSGHRTSALLDALGRVSAANDTLRYVEFGRPKATLAANGGGNDGPYQRVLGYGASQLATFAQVLSDVVGLNPLAADVAVFAGYPPKNGGWLSPVDRKLVTDRLVGLGGTRDGDSIRMRPDNQIDLTDKLATAVPGLLGELNLVRFDGSGLVYGRSTDSLALVSAASGSSLAEDPKVRAVAECLGDPLAALLSNDPKTVGTGNPGSVVAVGVLGAAGADPTEVACLSTGSDSAADAAAARIKTALAGVARSRSQPWTDLLRDPSVEVVAGHVVRLTAHPGSGQSAGILLAAVTTGDLGGLLG